MRFIILSILGLTLLCSCDQITIDNNRQNRAQSEKHNLKKYENFKLLYSYAGLGSGMGSIQPTFSATGADYVYSLEQNSSFTGEFQKKPEFICKGKLRESSIDSIVNLVKDIKDTLIYKTNTGIMSGGIHVISIKNDKINITFRLHNASDPIAQKIVDIVNSNIPNDKKRLWLFGVPNEK